ncbi:hypothetical protein UFOVP1328_58 [uncultured Caudovirales phage]|uniref:Uncharacterized protein n=1 Tax=uncultured Caudovirales phage TaxID=2100421 RepID=A0A6J5RYL0_9CAUD|nr:hypothetical protein UFOVP1084_21 [uncultured Caudovirales phage]CAB4199557.1 hypothetical protein UFOVP1328_58 [uncultured Caudovirales phage]CAB5228352.1 hypothetical protein UFOVP1532_26 [uncultured Caudovirales phage]
MPIDYDPNAEYEPDRRTDTVILREWWEVSPGRELYLTVEIDHDHREVYVRAATTDSATPTADEVFYWGRVRNAPADIATGVAGIIAQSGEETPDSP